MLDPNPLPSTSVAIDLAFLAADDIPIPYMKRLQEWKLAIGNSQEYIWAHFADVPFSRLTKPLQRCTVAVVTTAAPFQADKGDQGPGAPYNTAAKFFDVYSRSMCHDHDVRIAHVGIDRKHTSMEDSRCWFPVPTLRTLEMQGRIGRIASRFYGVPTRRDPQRTLDVDAVDVLARCRVDAVDAVILIPNCTICHQSLSLVARVLEREGIPTILMACAKDIVEHVGVPRMLFSDFPLGNAAGKPHDEESQLFTLNLALDVLESACAPRTTVQSPLRWSDDATWKRDFSNIRMVSPEDLQRLREEFSAQVVT